MSIHDADVYADLLLFQTQPDSLSLRAERGHEEWSGRAPAPDAQGRGAVAYPSPESQDIIMIILYASRLSEFEMLMGKALVRRCFCVWIR